jgi:hypothetical protein
MEDLTLSLAKLVGSYVKTTKVLCKLTHILTKFRVNRETPEGTDDHFEEIIDFGTENCEFLPEPIRRAFCYLKQKNTDIVQQLKDLEYLLDDPEANTDPFYDVEFADKYFEEFYAICKAQLEF